jgi:hypothetical protein
MRSRHGYENMPFAGEGFEARTRVHRKCRPSSRSEVMISVLASHIYVDEMLEASETQNDEMTEYAAA